MPYVLVLVLEAVVLPELVLEIEVELLVGLILLLEDGVRLLGMILVLTAWMLSGLSLYLQ